MGLIGQIIVDIVLAAVAAVVLPVVTLGRVRLMPAELAADLPAGTRRWHGVHRHPSGVIGLDENAAVTAWSSSWRRHWRSVSRSSAEPAAAASAVRQASPGEHNRL